jgi:4-amino-4-deoxy-L-arabinose transferase-like glycosyltransferase
MDGAGPSCHSKLAMPPSTLSLGMTSAFERLIDRLCDPARRRRVMFALTVAYALLWWLYAVIAKSSQDMNGDMAEMVVWSRDLAFGYPRHPPLLAWIVAAWFAIFPLADWAYYLLATITVSAGLGLAFEVADEWLDGTKRAAVPVLLSFIPFYNFLGLKFDQNTVQISLWALTTWAFVRSLRTQSAGFAILAGVAAAAAVLTKYWSAFLLISLVVASLFDRQRPSYYRSVAPYLTIGVGLLLVAPHLIWLVHENFVTIIWGQSRSDGSASEVLSSFLEYCGGSVGYAAGMLLVLLLLRPALDWPPDGFFPRDADRRTAALIFWLPPLLPLVVAVALRIKPVSVWNAPAYTMLPVLLLASPRIDVPRAALARIMAVSLALVLGSICVAPIVAYLKLVGGVENDAAYGRLVASEVDRAWRKTSDRPLRIIAGPFALVSTVAFYAEDRPVTYGEFSARFSPLIDDRKIAQDGMAMVCPIDNDPCLRTMASYAAQRLSGIDVDVELARPWLGFVGPPRRFRIGTLAPRA